MVSLRPKKKLHARRAGSLEVIEKVGPHVHDLPLEFGFSSTFNTADLIESRELAAIPSEVFEPTPSIEREPDPECPPIIWPKRGIRIEHVLDDRASMTRDSNFQHHLVS